jgi:large subunit ribosomal protein L30
MPAIKVTLIRSRAGRPADQLATLAGLGLYLVGHHRILPATDAVLGMCRKLGHMVKWEKVSDDPPKRRSRRAVKKP